MEQRFQIGVITSPHGVQGEVKVYPTTDDPRRFKRLKDVILVTDKEEKKSDIENVKFIGQMVILKLAGCDRREDAEKLRNCSLYVTRDKAVKLQKDEYFIADLIGMEVLSEEDNKIGVLEDVISTGANDVYVIRKTDGRELLLPAIKECILEVRIEEGMMKVHVLDGLEE